MTRRPFKFRLERVRALRESIEDLAREDLAASLSTRLEGEAMLQAASELHRDAQLQRRLTTAELSGDELCAHQAYLERTARARESAALELDRRDADVDARRTALLAAARDRQALERLKERKRRDHLLDDARRDGAALDEIAQRRSAAAAAGGLA